MAEQKFSESSHDLYNFQKGTSLNQPKNAVFLPALSSFYSTFIGRQRYEQYVDPARIPAGFTNGLENLNFLNKQESIFYYPWALYSAGHANLDTTTNAPKEDMIRNRDRSSTFVVGDSGGFQIAQGTWPGNWPDPTDAKALKQRDAVVKWMDAYMDYGMVLDIPTITYHNPKASEVTGIKSYMDAVVATQVNNDYFIRNRNGNCKFLNVLQGSNHAEADDWYSRMKDYSDPKKYPNEHFNGWAMGGQNMSDVHLILKRLVALRFDGLLEKGVHDWMHFLGTSRLEWAVLLTDIQDAIRKYHNENFTASFDCASPFLATANGMIYTHNRTPDRGKWTYRMEPSADNKNYATDTRKLGDVLRDDDIVTKIRDRKGNILYQFTDSPVSDLLQVKDVCYYAPGMLNKIGKEGKTSWDSFSYMLQMGHNLYMHMDAVRQGQEVYKQGIVPDMLVDERFDSLFFRDIANAVFETSDRDKALKIIDEYDRFYMKIIGSRGFRGGKALNANTYFGKMFTVTKVDPETVQTTEEDLDVDKLEELEISND